jgi:hypothetical protein
MLKRFGGYLDMSRAAASLATRPDSAPTTVEVPSWEEDLADSELLP